MIIEWQYTCKCGFHTRDRAISDRPESDPPKEIFTRCRKCGISVVAKITKVLSAEEEKEQMAKWRHRFGAGKGGE
jgi:hypothetical protein